MFKNESDFERLCLKLNYQFRNKELLAQAMTTRAAWRGSLQKAVIGHHEEMAFFGDGILRMVVDKILMEEFPYYNVGDLSKTRDLLVKNANLSDVAKKLELEKYIFMDSNQAKQCQQGNPKLLADTIEAIIYAIYKDSGERLLEVKKFILSHSGISDALNTHREKEEENHMPIIFAIRSGKVENVQKMLEEGFPINFLFSHIEYEFTNDMYDPGPIVHEKSLTPLDFALKCLEKIAIAKYDPTNMLSIIECLLKFGANSNLHAKDAAALIRQLFVPRSLDGKVADSLFAKITQKYQNRQDPKRHIAGLDKVIKEMSIPNWERITDQVVEMLCRSGAKLDEENYSQYNTLLELAIIHQQKYKINILLQCKINPNIQNNLGETPLHLAVLFADEALIIQLLDAGADPTVADKEDLTPFDKAPKPELKILLLKAEIEHALPVSNEVINIEEIKTNAMNYYNKWLNDKLSEELAKAIRLFSQVLKCKLHKKNWQDKSLVTDFYNLGTAYFHRRNYKKAKSLLERARFLYQMNEQQFQQKTDKYLNRLVECEKYILESKYQKNTAAPDSQLNYYKFDQDLFSVTQVYNSAEVKTLLNNGANPDAVSETEGPILHHAIQIYNTVVLMGETTSDLPYNEVGIGGFKYKVLEIIQMLLAFGADPNQRDKTGKTALHIAAIVNKPNVVELLLLKGADPCLRDHSNNFASHYAKDSNTRRLILSALRPVQSSTSLLQNQSSSSSSDNIKRTQNKTTLCKFFKEGNPNSCNKGDQCGFAHGITETINFHV